MYYRYFMEREPPIFQRSCQVNYKCVSQALPVAGSMSHDKNGGIYILVLVLKQ